MTDPELKRKTIGRLFIDEFQALAETMSPKAEFLLQGTLYPDVIESISYKVCVYAAHVYHISVRICGIFFIPVYD